MEGVAAREGQPAAASAIHPAGRDRAPRSSTRLPWLRTSLPRRSGSAAPELLQLVLVNSLVHSDTHLTLFLRTDSASACVALRLTPSSAGRHRHGAQPAHHGHRRWHDESQRRRHRGLLLLHVQVRRALLHRRAPRFLARRSYVLKVQRGRLRLVQVLRVHHLELPRQQRPVNRLHVVRWFSIPARLTTVACRCRIWFPAGPSETCVGGFCKPKRGQCCLKDPGPVDCTKYPGSQDPR